MARNNNSTPDKRRSLSGRCLSCVVVDVVVALVTIILFVTPVVAAAAANGNIGTDTSDSYDVPVHFVVFQPSEYGGKLTLEQADEMVNELNTHGFADTKFRFYLATDASSSPAPSIREEIDPDLAACNDHDTFRPEYRAGNGAFDELTVFLCNTEFLDDSNDLRGGGIMVSMAKTRGSFTGKPLLGIGTLPGDLDDNGVGNSWKKDGVVVLNPALLKPEHQYVSSQILIHEVGHWYVYCICYFFITMTTIAS